MPQSKPKKKRNGPEPERLKIEGDPEQQFRKLLRPVPKPARKQGRARPHKQGK